MILLSLAKYYERLRSEGEIRVPEMGFQEHPIPFIIVLNREGVFRGILDMRTGEGRGLTARNFMVPKAVKRTSGIAANLLWDNPAYVLGCPKKDERKDPNKALKRAEQQHEAFVEEIRERCRSVLDDEGVQAVLRFLEARDFSAIYQDPCWPEIEKTGANLSFQLEGDWGLVCQRPRVQEAIRATCSQGGEPRQPCLVTGELDVPARLHAPIKGVRGGQSSGTNIVSFNLPAFWSYQKAQGANAPVGGWAEFAYTTALNTLLAKDSGRRFQLGDEITAVFWADKKHRMEEAFLELFGEVPPENSEADCRELVSLLKSPQTGIPPDLDPATRFFVLGLSPNAARLIVRFWYAGSVADLAAKMDRYFEDISMVQPKGELRYPSLSRLLGSLAPQRDKGKLPPNLGAEFLRSVLQGLPYPKGLMEAAVRRARAERGVDYARAALIKAVLVRQARVCGKETKEVGMSLDPGNEYVGYRLGRLFAVLEKIQEEANPGINTTIRERFYGAASATPVTVFPHLMKLKNHHLAKLENRRRVTHFERLIGQIIDGLESFPANMSLAEQGRFAVGYYHQRQAFYVKPETEEKREGRDE
jgi:CRISPR-associated protein Csd1